MATSLDENLLGPNMLDLMYSTLNRQLIDLGGMMGLGTEEIAGLRASFLPHALKTGWSKEVADPVVINSRRIWQWIFHYSNLRSVYRGFRSEGEQLVTKTGDCGDSAAISG
jgi:hypothetical protein